MNQIFTNDLSNMSSDGATKLAKNVTTEVIILSFNNAYILDEKQFECVSNLTL